MNATSPAITSAERRQRAVRRVHAPHATAATNPAAAMPPGHLLPGQPSMSPGHSATPNGEKIRFAKQRRQDFRPAGRRPASASQVRAVEVDANRGLQAAVLLVLALYASMALLKISSDLPRLVQHWHQFVEFLAGTLFTA